MSWDTFVSRTPVDQLEEANLEALGSKQAVAAQLREILPSVSFNDPDWGSYRDDECSMEISLGEKEEPDHLMLHIRGGGNRAISIVREICEKFNCFLAWSSQK